MPQLCCQCCQSSPRQARAWVDDRPFFPLHPLVRGHVRLQHNVTTGWSRLWRYPRKKGGKKEKGKQRRKICRHSFTLCLSSSIHRPGPGSWARRTSVPAHSPHDTFDNLVIALVSLSSRKSKGAALPLVGPSALSHLACRFELVEGSLSTPVRAAPGHGQAAHAHCNFAIILLLPSPPRPSLTSSSTPPPPSRCLPSRAVLLVRIRCSTQSQPSPSFLWV